VFGLGDTDLHNDMANANGWMLEFEPELANNEAYFAVYRNGNIITNGGSRKLVTLNNTYDAWTAFGYSVVGDERGTVTLSEGISSQITSIAPIDTLPVPVTSKGPANFDGRITLSVQASNTNTGLTVDIGGATRRSFGKDQPTFRITDFGFVGQNIGTANTWVPLTAIRVDQSRLKIRADLAFIQILGYSENENVAIIAKAFQSPGVTFTGGDSWSTPDGVDDANSIIQTRTDIDQFFDQSGTLTSTTNSPGGYIIGRTAQGTGDKSHAPRGRTQPGILKRSLYDGDILLILGKATGTGNVDYEVKFNERF